MENSMEYCSFVSEDYIICECGDNFSNEEDLRLHLEQCRVTEKEEPTPTPNTGNSSKEPIILIRDHIVKIEPVEQPEQEPKEIKMKQENIIYEVEINEFNQIVLKTPATETWLQTRPPPPRGADGGGAGSRPLVVKEPSHDPYAGTQVTFKVEAMEDEPVVLMQGSEEHDYDREAPRPDPEGFFCVLGSEEHGYDREAHRPLFCELCGKSFHSLKCVHQHVARQHSGRPPPRRAPDHTRKAVCDVCGKHYASNAALRYHQRVHTGEKPYQCMWCPKAFTMPLFLQIHVRTHTGERPYACSLCPKAFSNKAALLRHDRVHTGVKPYPCPECGKSFSQSNSMKLHVHTVHLKLPAPYKSAARRTKQRLAQTNAVQRTAVPREKKKATGDVKLVQNMSDCDGATMEYVDPEQAFPDDEEDYEYEEVLVPMQRSKR